MGDILLKKMMLRYMFDVGNQTVPRKAMRWALSISPEMPEKDILLPGMCLPGLVRYIHRCFSLQVMPEPFIALL